MNKEMNIKKLIEHFGGKCLFGGSLIQFNEDSFNEMYRQIYDAGMLIERARILDIVKEGLWDVAGLRNHLEQEDKNHG